MTVLFGILYVLAVSGFMVVSAMRVPGGALSHYELDRRAHTGDHHAADVLRRQLLTGDIEGLIHAKRLALFALSCIVAIPAFGVGWAMLLILVTIVCQPVVSRLPSVVRLGHRAYGYYEPIIMRFLERYPWVGKILRTHQIATTKLQAGSPEELAHIIDQAGAHLSRDQQALLLHSLKFDDHTVADVMTARDDIATIDHRELLGPLVLNDLHKTGHSFFPVTVTDLDHIIGVLPIDGFLTLDSKRSVTAEKAMIPHVEWIAQSAPLRVALRQFLASHQHLLVVKDDTGETVGVITLNDIVAMLFGR